LGLASAWLTRFPEKWYPPDPECPVTTNRELSVAKLQIFEMPNRATDNNE